MKEKTISSQHIYAGRVVNLYVDTVSIKSNKTAIREIVKHRGAVCVVGVTPSNKIVLVKQFRKAIEDDLIEIPAGKLEIGENPDEAIKREIKEETGYEVQTLEYITKFYTSPGFSNELGLLYFAKLQNKGDTHFDEDEDIEIIELELDEVVRMINDGRIIDAKTILGITMYKLQLIEKVEV